MNIFNHVFNVAGEEKEAEEGEEGVREWQQQQQWMPVKEEASWSLCRQTGQKEEKAQEA